MHGIHSKKLAESPMEIETYNRCSKPLKGVCKKLAESPMEIETRRSLVRSFCSKYGKKLAESPMEIETCP